MLFWLSTCQIRMHCTRKHEQSEVLATSSEGKSPPLYHTVIKLLFCNRFCSFSLFGGWLGGNCFYSTQRSCSPLCTATTQRPVLNQDAPCMIWWTSQVYSVGRCALSHPNKSPTNADCFLSGKMKKYLHNRTIFQKSHILVYKLPLHRHFSSVQCLHWRRAVHT